MSQRGSEDRTCDQSKRKPNERAEKNHLFYSGSLLLLPPLVSWLDGLGSFDNHFENLVGYYARDSGGHGSSVVQMTVVSMIFPKAPP